MSRRDDVLAALRAAGDAGASGELLARELGVSRAAVGKHVSALRGLGYRIDAAAGSGYVLRSAPDAPLPAEVRPLLRSTLWTRLEGGGETGSTNADARALARDGAPEGTVVLASAQTAGRGRLGREWASPEGGVYVSAVLRPEVSPAHAPSLALAVGLGVALALEGAGAHIGLKWPNDLQIDAEKLAGILLEMSAEADRVEWLVVGIGINVCAPAPAHALPGAACLSESVPDITRAQVAALVLDGIANGYEQWRDAGFSAMAGEYAARLVLVGRDVTVSDAAGREVARGEVRGVDNDGRLVIATGNGDRAIVAGEVTLRRPTA